MCWPARLALLRWRSNCLPHWHLIVVEAQAARGGSTKEEEGTWIGSSYDVTSALRKTEI
uniref:Uncharacterized protein n=1 Tax=Oryza sativa subsp. japonica TaxID=39947 RepID=Q69YD4_ORYSJ|nr:hypothetical protein [Oryza sativa Japonica Group]